MTNNAIIMKKTCNNIAKPCNNHAKPYDNNEKT